MIEDDRENERDQDIMMTSRFLMIMLSSTNYVFCNA